MEIWKDIKGYEGLYQVSNEGRIKSMKSGRWKTTERILKNSLMKNGYTRVNLCKDGVYEAKDVHRLVAETFIPNIDNKPCIGHQDCDKTNNNISNLYWCTYVENNNNPITRQRMSEGQKKVPKTRDCLGRFISINNI